MVHRSVSIIFEPVGRVLAIMQRFYRFVTSASTAGELGAGHRSQCRGLEQRFARLPFHATDDVRVGRLSSRNAPGSSTAVSSAEAYLLGEKIAQIAAH